MAKQTICQVEVRSKRVLMRVDFNVPIDGDGRITDDRRVRQALPTVRDVIQRGGRLILMSHLGRPGGAGFEPDFSLEPAAERLAELLPEAAVSFPGTDCVGPEAAAAVKKMRDGEIVVLENLRFHKAEKKGEADFAAKLAAYGDIYCNDAFGTAHRNDASMYAVPQAMRGKPRVIGLLMEKELKYLSEAIEHAQRPFVAVLGGAKVSDKVGAIENLLARVDSILVGGAMAYTLLAARGAKVGSSRVETDKVGDVKPILERADQGGTEILLPTDHVCGRALEPDTEVELFEGDIPDGWMGLDIGPATAARFSQAVGTARTIVWNGPLGAFETEPFDVGTRQVAEAIAKATAGGAVSIVGGGDSAAAVEAFGLDGRFSHVSTGGGASLEMLEGRSFDSLSVLDEA